MKSVLLPLHLAFVGIWLGCVLTEVLFERALLGKGRAQELILVALHKRVDLLVEIPAFAVVLVTGALMFSAANAGPLLTTKIAFGLLAITTNAYCVWLVFRRAAAANSDHWDEFAHLDNLQHKFGSLVLLAIVMALGVGVYLHVDVHNPLLAQAAPPDVGKNAVTRSPDRTFRFSTVGIGPIRLGMTLDEARSALPEARFERSSDGDGAALIDVSLGKESVMTLFANEDDSTKPIDWSKKITFLESFSPACVTAEGIRAGTPVLDAEKVYGKTKSIVRSEIESREYIQFQRQPEHLVFRIDYTGNFAEGARETTQFMPQATILSIGVSSN